MWGCGGANTLFCTSTHTLYTHLTRHLFPHSPNTSPPHLYTHLTRLSTLSHTHLPSPRTLSHPSHLSFTSHNTFPHSLPILPHNPHASSNTSLCSPYFITYPMPEFLTFLIYCQISLIIMYMLLETPCKFHTKFLKQKLIMATQHLSFNFRSGH